MKGSGTASGSIAFTEDTSPPFDCAAGSGTTVTTGPLTLTTFPDDPGHNEDALEWAPGKLFDSCSDYEELGTDATRGGLRDPFNPYDFYDVNGDGYINSPDDILQVQMAWGSRLGDPLYSPAKDRGRPLGPYAWNREGPDGHIDAPNDITAVKFQYQHDCRPAP